MLKKVSSVEKMEVCEKNPECKKCPCNIHNKCMHPYGLGDDIVGAIVTPSTFNTDERITEGKQYTILDKGDGLVKVALDNGETEWFSSEDFQEYDNSNG